MNTLTSNERLSQIREHDFPILLEFHSKHALGPLTRPSCLVCGRVPEQWPPAIQHAELPGIVVCHPCRDRATHETEARRCDVEVRAWMIEWPANGNMPARWWHPVTGWMLDTNSAVRFVREEDAEAYMRNAGFVKGIVATEHAWIESQLQQETGLCPHGMPRALSECLPCVGANAQKAEEQRGESRAEFERDRGFVRRCPKCNRDVSSGCNYCACPYPQSPAVSEPV